MIDEGGKFDEAWLGDIEEPPAPTELELELMLRDQVRGELTSLHERMMKQIDRYLYYGEKIDFDEFDFLAREVARLLKLLQ